MFAEKRKYPRVNFSIPIKISDSDFDIVTETKNISAAGVYCYVNKKISVMTKLEIILLIPFVKNNKKDLRKINCKGIVVRDQCLRSNSTYNYSIGVYFNVIKESDRKTVLSYVKSHLA